MRGAGPRRADPAGGARDLPMPLFGRGFRTLLAREIRRFLVVAVQTVVTPLVTAGLYLTIFVGGLGDRLEGVQEGATYLAYLVPGLVMMGALNQSFMNATSTILISKFQNNLVDVLVTPLTDVEIVAAYAFASAARGVLVGVLTWLVTLPFGGPVPVSPFLAALFLGAGTMIFALLGVGAGILAYKFDDIARISTFVILPLTYLGGVFLPISKYPEAVRPWAHLNPLLYCIDGQRLAFLGASEVGMGTSIEVIGLALLITGCFALASLKLSSAVRN